MQSYYAKGIYWHKTDSVRDPDCMHPCNNFHVTSGAAACWDRKQEDPTVGGTRANGREATNFVYMNLSAVFYEGNTEAKDEEGVSQCHPLSWL